MSKNRMVIGTVRVLGLAVVLAVVGGGVGMNVVSAIPAKAGDEFIPGLRTYPIDQSKSQLSLEVLVDARRMSFPDQRPINKDGRLLVPLRFVSDALGGKCR